MATLHRSHSLVNARPMILVGAMMISNAGCVSAQHSAVPRGGFVPDSSTAVLIARAIESRHDSGGTAPAIPLTASLRAGSWVIHVAGATSPLMTIAKADGRISGLQRLPAANAIDNERVAAAIGYAVLAAAYGAREIDAQLPLSVTSQGEAWIVIGQRPVDTLGGVAHIEIARSDGRVLRMTHGR